jgi:hypothetical protein
MFDTTSSNDKICISGGIFRSSSAFKRSVLFGLLAEEILTCQKKSNENQTPALPPSPAVFNTVLY